MRAFQFFASVLVLLSSAVSYGFHEASYGLHLSSFAAGSIAANPPLPMLYFKKGNKKLSVQPGYLEGSIDSNSIAPSGTFRTKGQIFGGGGAAAYSHALGDSIGLYGLMIGDKIGGEFSYTSLTCSPYCTTVSMKDIKTSFVTAGLGFMWTAIGGNEKDFFSLGLFGGPAFTSAQLSQRVTQTDTSGNLTDDFEMEVTPSMPSFFVGLQMGFRFGDTFLLTPYFVGSGSISDSKCHEYKVTKTTVDGSLDGQSTPECGGNSGASAPRNKIDLVDGFSAVGINATILPLHLTINVFADAGKPKDTDLKSFKQTLYLVTFSIGTE